MSSFEDELDVILDDSIPHRHAECGANGCELPVLISEAKAAITAAHERTVEQALLDAAVILSGMGSQGDKVNGNPMFMMGIESAEETLRGYAEDIPLLAKNAADRRARIKGEG